MNNPASDWLVLIRSLVAGFELSADITTLWVASLVWLAVSALTLVDDRASEKISNVKELLGILKLGQKKE